MLLVRLSSIATALALLAAIRADAEQRLLSPNLLEQRVPGGSGEEAIGQIEALHRVPRVERRARILGGDARRRELAGQRRPSHEEGDVDPRGAQIFTKQRRRRGADDGAVAQDFEADGVETAGSRRPSGAHCPLARDLLDVVAPFGITLPLEQLRGFRASLAPSGILILATAAAT